MRNAHVRGLTLIELLIAVAVFSVLSALAYSGLNNILLTSSHTRAEAQQLATLQMAMRFLQRDVEQVLDRPVRDQYGDPKPPLVSAEPSAEEPMISFTRAGWANPAGQPRSTLQRVAYDLDEEDERLIRVTWPLLDGASEETMLKTTLLESVTELEFRFMNEEGQWQRSWPPLLQDPNVSHPLPKALEVTMTAEPWGEIQRILPLPR
jgi:general secretion pathway protein J